MQTTKTSLKNNQTIHFHINAQDLSTPISKSIPHLNPIERKPTSEGISETFVLEDHYLLKEYLETNTYCPEKFFHIVSQVFSLLIKLDNLNIQLNAIFKDFLIVNPAKNTIHILNSSLLNEFINDPHDIHQKQIHFRNDIQFTSEFILMLVTDKKYKNLNFLSKDSSNLSSTFEQFFKIQAIASSIIEFLFEFSLCQKTNLTFKHFEKKFLTILYHYNEEKKNQDTLFSFTNTPFNKLYTLSRIKNKVLESIQSQKTSCFILDGEIGCGKKHTQHYCTSKILQSHHIFSINIDFEPANSTDMSPFITSFNWFIKQCIAAKENAFFNHPTFLNFSRDDQVILLNLFPEIKYFLKTFAIPTHNEKTNVLSYNINLLIENFLNLFILKNPLVINLFNVHHITDQKTNLLINLFQKLNTPCTVTIGVSTSNSLNNATTKLLSFIKSNFETTKIHIAPLSQQELTNIIKKCFKYPIYNLTEFASLVHTITVGNILYLKHFLLLLESNQVFSLHKNKITWSKNKLATFSTNNTITNQIQGNISSLSKEEKEILSFIACFDIYMKIKHLYLLNTSITKEKMLSFIKRLIQNHFIRLHDQESPIITDKSSIKFTNIHILKLANQLTSQTEKSDIRYQLGLTLFETYPSLNHSDTMLMTFCLSENFHHFSTHYKSHFLCNHVITLSKLLRQKGNFHQGIYLLNNYLKVYAKHPNGISEKEFSMLLIEKGFHLHFIKKFATSHKSFLKATKYRKSNKDKISIGTQEVSLYNKKGDFYNGYKVTRNHLKFINIHFPDNPNNVIKLTLLTLKNLFSGCIKSLFLPEKTKKEMPKEIEKALEIIISNFEMSVSNNQFFILFQLTQIFNLSSNYKKNHFLSYTKYSFTAFLNYVNIIALPFYILKRSPIKAQSTSETTSQKINFIADFVIKLPFSSLSDLEGKAKKFIHFFMSINNTFFTYGTKLMLLFIQFLNGQPLHHLHSSITKDLEWAKNYMTPFQLFENYFNLFDALYNGKTNFPNIIFLNFNKNDIYFRTSSLLQLIIFHFFNNELKKAANIIPKVKLNSSTGIFYYAFHFFSSLTYGLLSLKSSNKEYKKEFKTSSKFLINLERNKDFKFNFMSDIIKIIHLLHKKKVVEAQKIYPNLVNKNHFLSAITNEIFGIFYFKNNVPNESNFYYTKSLDATSKWGNKLKYNCLKAQLKPMFPKLNIDTINSTNKINTLLSSIKTAHTISKEKSSEKLLKSLILTLKEHLCTSQISCILHENSELILYSQLKKNSYICYKSKLENHTQKLPTTLVTYVFNSKETIKLNSLQNNISFYDNYINLGNTNSAISSPILNQNRNLGVLYLEKDNKTPFSDDDLVFLNIISSQAANSLENSILFEKNKTLINNLEEKVKEQIKSIQIKEIEKQKSEEIATKASQQAAYATLTRGIAHEIRNPMAMILSGVELIQDNLSDTDKITEYTQTVKELILRLKTITSTMLRYGKPVSGERTLSDINQLIEDALIVSNAECKKRQISIEKNLESLPKINLEPASISQVFLNLILNSIEAINKKGNISIQTNSENTENASYIKITITDSGKGISRENITKIFNPFYSSKYGNTGLGLSIVLKIINEHNGKVNIESEEEKFTSVIIKLPVTKD